MFNKILKQNHIAFYFLKYSLKFFLSNIVQKLSSVNLMTLRFCHILTSSIKKGETFVSTQYFKRVPPHAPWLLEWVPWLTSGLRYTMSEFILQKSGDIRTGRMRRLNLLFKLSQPHCRIWLRQNRRYTSISLAIKTGLPSMFLRKSLSANQTVLPVFCLNSCLS